MVNGEALSFNEGSVHLSSGTNLTVNSSGGAITFEKRIRDTNGQNFTVNAGDTAGSTDTAVFSGGIGFGDSLGAVSITAADGISLGSGVHTTGNIAFTGPVTLTGGVTVDSNHSGTDGTVTFSSTIDGSGQALTIDSGSGAVLVQGAIGSGAALSSVTVNTSGAGTISLANIGGTNSGVTGATSVGNTDTETLTLSGSTYNTTGTQQYTSTSGENIDLTKGSTTTFTTANNNITFGTGTVEMGNGSNLVVNTGTGIGNINMVGGVMGTSSETVTLTAGTGTVAIGAIGSGSEIADVTITSTGTTTFSGDFVGGNLSNTGPVVVSSNINIGSGNVTFGGTLDSQNGNQSITFNNPSSDINITGAIGGTNAFSTFTITDGGTFTYGVGDVISGFVSGKFSRNGGFATFNPGPSIDNINTIEKTQDKEIAFFDAPVFKLIKSFVNPTISDLIKEKGPAVETLSVPTIKEGPAISNTDFLDSDSRIDGETKDTDIKVDFLDGDILIIDKSLEVANFEFDSIETTIDEIDSLSIQDDSDLTINSTTTEIFKTSSLKKINGETNLEQLLISFSRNENLGQDNTFVF